MSDEYINEEAKVEEKVLSFQDIINTDDIEIREIHIKAWHGSVKVKVFTKAEQQEIRRKIAATSAANGGTPDGDEFEKLVIMTGMYEPEITAEQYTLLLGKSATAMQELADAIMEINGLTETAEEEAEKSFPA